MSALPCRVFVVFALASLALAWTEHLPKTTNDPALVSHIHKRRQQLHTRTHRQHKKQYLKGSPFVDQSKNNQPFWATFLPLHQRSNTSSWQRRSHGRHHKVEERHGNEFGFGSMRTIPEVEGYVFELCVEIGFPVYPMIDVLVGLAVGVMYDPEDNKLEVYGRIAGGATAGPPMIKLGVFLEGIFRARFKVPETACTPDAVESDDFPSERPIDGVEEDPECPRCEKAKAFFAKMNKLRKSMWCKLKWSLKSMFKKLTRRKLTVENGPGMKMLDKSIDLRKELIRAYEADIEAIAEEDSTFAEILSDKSHEIMIKQVMYQAHLLNKKFLTSLKLKEISEQIIHVNPRVVSEEYTVGTKTYKEWLERKWRAVFLGIPEDKVMLYDESPWYKVKNMFKEDTFLLIASPNYPSQVFYHCSKIVKHFYDKIEDETQPLGSTAQGKYRQAAMISMCQYFKLGMLIKDRPKEVYNLPGCVASAMSLSAKKSACGQLYIQPMLEAVYPELFGRMMPAEAFADPSEVEGEDNRHQEDCYRMVATRGVRPIKVRLSECPVGNSVIVVDTYLNQKIGKMWFTHKKFEDEGATFYECVMACDTFAYKEGDISGTYFPNNDGPQCQVFFWGDGDIDGSKMSLDEMASKHGPRKQCAIQLPQGETRNETEFTGCVVNEDTGLVVNAYRMLDGVLPWLHHVVEETEDLDTSRGELGPFDEDTGWSHRVEPHKVIFKRPSDPSEFSLAQRLEDLSYLQEGFETDCSIGYKTKKRFDYFISSSVVNPNYRKESEEPGNLVVPIMKVETDVYPALFGLIDVLKDELTKTTGLDTCELQCTCGLISGEVFGRVGFTVGVDGVQFCKPDYNPGQVSVGGRWSWKAKPITTSELGKGIDCLPREPVSLVITFTFAYKYYLGVDLITEIPSGSDPTTTMLVIRGKMPVPLYKVPAGIVFMRTAMLNGIGFALMRFVEAITPKSWSGHDVHDGAVHHGDGLPRESIAETERNQADKTMNEIGNVLLSRPMKSFAALVGGGSAAGVAGSLFSMVGEILKMTSPIKVTHKVLAGLTLEIEWTCEKSEEHHRQMNDTKSKIEIQSEGSFRSHVRVRRGGCHVHVAIAFAFESFTGLEVSVMGTKLGSAYMSTGTRRMPLSAARGVNSPLFTRFARQF